MDTATFTKYCEILALSNDPIEITNTLAELKRQLDTVGNDHYKRKLQFIITTFEKKPNAPVEIVVVKSEKEDSLTDQINKLRGRVRRRTEKPEESSEEEKHSQTTTKQLQLNNDTIPRQIDKALISQLKEAANINIHSNLPILELYNLFEMCKQVLKSPTLMPSEVSFVKKQMNDFKLDLEKGDRELEPIFGQLIKIKI